MDPNQDQTSQENDTEGKVLDRLTPSQLNMRIRKILLRRGFKVVCKAQVPIAEQSGCFMRLYTKGPMKICIFSCATDNLAKKFTRYTGGLPRCREILDYMKNDPRFKEAINAHVGVDKNVYVEIPLATSYHAFRLRVFTSHHFRVLSLNMNLDPNRQIQVTDGSLINSRGAAIGSLCPTYNIEQDVKYVFPNCVLKFYNTGHQTMYKVDNNSCGYHVASYIAQIADGVPPGQLIDNVRCSTGLLRLLRIRVKGVPSRPVPDSNHYPTIHWPDPNSPPASVSLKPGDLDQIAKILLELGSPPSPPTQLTTTPPPPPLPQDSIGRIQSVVGERSPVPSQTTVTNPEKQPIDATPKSEGEEGVVVLPPPPSVPPKT